MRTHGRNTAVGFFCPNRGSKTRKYKRIERRLWGSLLVVLWGSCWEVLVELSTAKQPCAKSRTQLSCLLEGTSKPEGPLEKHSEQKGPARTRPLQSPDFTGDGATK